MTPDTSSYQLTDSGDLYISKNISGYQMNTVSDITKTKQDIITILKTIKGSYPLNPDFGMDYQLIIRTGFHEPTIRACITSALHNHPDILTISDIVIKHPSSSRKLNVSLRVKTRSNANIIVTTDLPSP